jgi:hypothetical protein
MSKSRVFDIYKVTHCSTMSDDEKSHRHSDNEMDGSGSETDRHSKSRHKVKEKPQPISPTIPEAKNTGIDREKVHFSYLSNRFVLF